MQPYSINIMVGSCIFVNCYTDGEKPNNYYIFGNGHSKCCQNISILCDEMELNSDAWLLIFHSYNDIGVDDSNRESLTYSFA